MEKMEGGIPEQSKTKTYEEEAPYLYDSLLEKNSPELENALDKIDFDFLQKIFFNKIDRYIKDEKRKEQFISRWRIGSSALKGAIATYRTDMKAIFVDIEKVKNQFENEKLRELKILELVCHEETHALSHSEHVVIDNDDSYYSENKIGFDKTIISFNKLPKNASWEEMAEAMKNRDFKKERLFEFLNEGITEKFAQTIFQEYLAHKIDLTDEEKEEYGKYASYQANVALFENICGMIARELGHDEKFIEEAFYSSMFGGDDLADPEFQKAVDSATAEGFSKFMFNFEIRNNPETS